VFLLRRMIGLDTLRERAQNRLRGMPEHCVFIEIQKFIVPHLLGVVPKLTFQLTLCKLIIHDIVQILVDTLVLTIKSIGC